jgi:hypothetical protein
VIDRAHGQASRDCGAGFRIARLTRRFCDPHRSRIGSLEVVEAQRAEELLDRRVVSRISHLACVAPRPVHLELPQEGLVSVDPAAGARSARESAVGSAELQRSSAGREHARPELFRAFAETCPSPATSAATAGETVGGRPYSWFIRTRKRRSGGISACIAVAEIHCRRTSILTRVQNRALYREEN